MREPQASQDGWKAIRDLIKTRTLGHSLISPVGSARARAAAKRVHEQVPLTLYNKTHHHTIGFATAGAFDGGAATSSPKSDAKCSLIASSDFPDVSGKYT